MKSYLHFLKDRITSLTNKTSELKFKCAKYEFFEDRQK